MKYEKQILSVLAEAGKRGISVQSIVRHVYNMNTTFFHQPDLEQVRTAVRNYLQRNSRSAQSLVERTGRRGYYRLNTSGSADARQLLLTFSDGQQPKEEEKPREDLSLSLFPD